MKKDQVIIWIIIIYMVSLPLIISVVMKNNIQNKVIPEINRTVENKVKTVFESYNIIVR